MYYTPEKVNPHIGSLTTIKRFVRTPQFFCVRRYASYALMPTNRGKMLYFSYLQVLEILL